MEERIGKGGLLQLFCILITISLISIILSCGRESKADNTAAIPGNIPEKIPATTGTTPNSPQGTLSSDSNYGAYRTENINGKKILVFGGAKLTDITPSDDLRKDSSIIEAYIITVEKFQAEYLEYLKHEGISVGCYIPDNSIVVKMPAGRSPNTLKGVVAVVPYQPYFKFSKSDGDVNSLRKAKVSLWKKEDAQKFKEYCSSKGWKISGNTGKEYIIEGGNLKDVLFQEMVLRVEKYRDSAVFSVSGGKVSEVIWKSSDWKSLVSDSAKVSVLDMGIESAHGDLSGAIANIYENAGDGDTGEVVSHGTHMAGIIAGRGNLSQGRVVGVNPGAKIDFYALGDDLKGLVVPPSLEGIFRMSLLNNSCIANLSWGTYDEDNDGKYMSISRDVDGFVYEHPEMIVVAAVGNNGRSIASPATAKNVISVGALDGGVLASYSGRGGCSDGRVKPDVTVQGSGIESLGLNNSYAVMNGTSQAAAVVSGILSKLYGAVKQQFGVKPTHSVMKSLLIANTPEEKASDGFGNGRLYFDTPLDAAHFAVKRYASAGELGESVYTLKAGDDLTVVLSWTEPPVSELAFSQLVNDLDVEVTDPSGRITSLNDHVNNVEKIVIKGTSAGQYKVKVIGRVVPMALSDASLVIKSRMGFGGSASAATEALQAQSGQLVDSGGGSAGTTAGAVNTGVNTGGTSGNTSATGDVGVGSSVETPTANTATAGGASGGTTASTGVSTAAAASGDLSGLASTGSSTAIADRAEVYCRRTDGGIEVRPMGGESGQLVGIKFEGQGIESAEESIPVAATLDGEYRRVNVTVSGDAADIPASLLVRKSGSGVTNSVPVDLKIDADAPVLGDRYPLENGVLTNTVAWIDLKDSGSGLDLENLKIGVNGVVLSTNQYSYRFDSGRLSLYFDQIMPGDSKRAVKVSFAQAQDIVGNVLTNSEWNFKYDLKFDDRPPAKPVNVTVAVTNKRLNISWDPNQEADILGYHVYLLSADYMDQQRIDRGMVLTNYYIHTNYLQLTRRIENIAVSAVDTSTNESELAVVSVNKEYQNNPPVVFIDGIPKRTNGNVTASIHLADEGLIVETNIRLNNVKADIDWSSNGGTLVVDTDGKYKLAAVVMDDDGNIVSNVVEFTVDKSAPLAPEDISWTNIGKNVVLSWSKVMKDGEEVEKYSVYLGGTNLAGDLKTTNYTFEASEYGRYSFGVSASDSLGNESAKGYVIADTEKGIILKSDKALFNGNIPLAADVKVGLSRYDSLKVILSNSVNQKSFDYQPAEAMDTVLPVNDLADGKYTLKIVPVSDGVELTKYQLLKKIEIDRISPDINISINGEKKGGNYYVIGTNSQVLIESIDSNFTEMDVQKDNFGVEQYYSRQAQITLADSTGIVITVFDAAGNSSSRRIRMVVDKAAPVVNITAVNPNLAGQISDDNLTGYQVLTNGGIYFESESGIDGKICILPSGWKGTLTVQAEDAAGYVSSFQTNINSSNDNKDGITSILINGKDATYYNTPNLDISYIGNVSDSVSYDLIKDGKSIISTGPVMLSNCIMKGIGDGNYTVKVTGGGDTKDKLTVVDTMAPVLLLNSYASGGTAVSNVFRVSDLNLDTVKVLIDGQSKSLSSTLPSGQYDILLTAFDKAGNTNSTASSLYVSEGSANEEEIVVDVNSGNVVHLSSSGTVETNTIADFRTALHYYNKQIRFKAIGDIASSSWSANGGLLSANNIQNEGQYTVALYAQKKSGDDFKTSFVVTLDKTDPVVQLPVTNNSVVSKIPQLTAIDNFGLSRSTIQLDGAPMWQEKYVGEGRHLLEAEFVDKAGNRTVTNLTFELDHLPPSIFSSVKEGNYTKGAPDVIVYDAHPKSQKVLIDGIAFNGSAISEGNHTMQVLAEDAAGNSTNFILTNFTVDNTAPVAGLSPSGGIYREVTIMTNVTDPALKSSKLYVNGKESDGKAIIIEGSYEVVLTAQDMAGNSTNVTAKYTIDRTAPKINVQKPAVGMAYSAGMTPQISVEDTNKKSVTMTLDGESYGGEAIAAEGSHNISVTAEDWAGNQSSTNLNFVVMKQLPQVGLNGVSGIFRNGRYYNADGLGLSAWTSAANPQDVNVFVNGNAQGKESALSADGEYEVYATAKVDVDGKAYTIASDKYDVVIDKAGPQIGMTGVSDGDKITKSVTVRVTGHGWLKELTLTLNNAQLPVTQSAMPDGSVVASYTLNPSDGLLVNGVNSLKASVRDELDRVSAASANLVYETDSGTVVSGSGGTRTTSTTELADSAPVIQISQYISNMVVNNFNTSIDVTDTNLSNIQLAIYTNYGVNKDGAIYYTPSGSTIALGSLISGYPEGPYLVQIIALDKGTNKSTTNLLFTVDRTAPSLTITGTPDGSIVTKANYNIQIDDTNLKSSSVYINGVPIDSGKKSYSNISITNSGFNKLEVRAEDLAGNTADKVYQVKIDQGSPQIFISGISSNGLYNANQTVTVQVQDDNLSNFVVVNKVYTNDTFNISNIVLNISGTNQVSFTADGYYNDLQVVAYDMASNSSALDYTYRIDREAPTIDLGASTNFSSGDFLKNVTFVIQAHDNYQLSNTYYRLDKWNGSWQQVGTTTSNNIDSKDMTLLTLSGLADDQYRLTVFAADEAGNTASNETKFTVDKKDPDIFITGITNGDYYNVSKLINVVFSDTNLNLAKCWIEITSSNATVTADSMNNTAATNLSFTAEAYYTLNIRAADKAGNESNVSMSFWIDKTPPMISWLGASNGVLTNRLNLVTESTDGLAGLSNVVYKITGCESAFFDNTNAVFTNKFGLVETPDFEINGDYNIQAIALDKAGNSATNSFDLRLDTVAPQIGFWRNSNEVISNLSQEVGGTNWKTNFNLEVRCFDANQIQKANIYVLNSDHTPNKTIANWDNVLTNAGTNCFTNSVNFKDILNSNNTLVAVVRDFAGNVSTNEIKYWFEKTQLGVGWLPETTTALNPFQFNSIATKGINDDFNANLKLKNTIGVTNVRVWEDTYSYQWLPAYTNYIDHGSIVETNVITNRFLVSTTNILTYSSPATLFDYTNLIYPVAMACTNGNFLRKTFWVETADMFGNTTCLTNALVVSKSLPEYQISFNESGGGFTLMDDSCGIDSGLLWYAIDSYYAIPITNASIAMDFHEVVTNSITSNFSYTTPSSWTRLDIAGDITLTNSCGNVSHYYGLFGQIFK